jgi:hypothetical protein
MEAPAAGLSEWEKWFFDHHGFLILEDVVPVEDLPQMVQVGTQWHALSQEELPLPLHRTGAPAWSTPDESPPGPNYINHVQYCDEAFARLVLNPAIIRVVRGLTGDNFTLVDTALTMMLKDGGEKNEGGFHGELGTHVPGGSAVPGEQWRDYHVNRGEIFAGFLNCGISLVDVPEGSGFVCLPGSHKRNFKVPDNTSNPEQSLVGAGVRTAELYDGPSATGSLYRYTVQNICPKAGSCIIFTETLRHGIRKWQGEQPRLTVFVSLSRTGPLLS